MDVRETVRPVLALPTLGPFDVVPRARTRAKAPFPLGAPGFEATYLGRNAVYRAVKRLGLSGAEVLVPAYHHGVEISALIEAGADVRFVRVDGETLMLDLEDAAAQMSPRTRALYLIHYAGFPQPLDAARAFCRRHGLWLIEDCALATFSSDGTRALGSVGDAAIFCFYKTVPVPHGGGLLMRVDPQAATDGEPLSAPPWMPTISHSAGSLFLTGERALGRPGAWVRRVVRAMTDAFVAKAWESDVPVGTQHFDRNVVTLGMSSVTRWMIRHVDAEKVVRRRRENWAALHQRLGGLRPPVWKALPEGVCPLFYALRVEDKDRVLEHLHRHQIEAVDFWRWSHPAMDASRFPEVERLRREVIELPCHQDLTRDDLERIADVTRAALSA
ncbi:MAG: DegT/DnrJ/EryC1/StrS aminotransferase family protein [Myxococcaceae bacterium]|nr:DegT/DnrJ/EryC1/StrS aminotransferase family protein [Myxococcaceae bacterium]